MIRAAIAVLVAVIGAVIGGCAAGGGEAEVAGSVGPVTTVGITTAPHPTARPTDDAATSPPPSTGVPPTVTAPTPTVEQLTTPYIFPVAGSASYGRDHHDYPATDIFADCGTHEVSPVNGILLEVRREDQWNSAEDNPATRGGRSVSILGDDGVRYYLAHMDTVEPGLEPGQRVQAGQPLATMGRTGRASGCHLHFAVSPPCPGKEWAVRRGAIWPWKYLEAWRAGEQLSPAVEVSAWASAHPDACAVAMADPDAALA